MKYRLIVVNGKKRGKKMGVPTINCQVPKNLPYKHGIYAGWIYLDNQKLPAAIHFGPRPVFGEDEISLEAHVLEQVIDVVGKQIELEFSVLVRKVKNFENADEMIKQIKKDIKEIKRLLDV